MAKKASHLQGLNSENITEEQRDLLNQVLANAPYNSNERQKAERLLKVLDNRANAQENAQQNPTPAPADENASTPTAENNTSSDTDTTNENTTEENTTEENTTDETITPEPLILNDENNTSAPNSFPINDENNSPSPSENNTSQQNQYQYTVNLYPSYDEEKEILKGLEASNTKQSYLSSIPKLGSKNIKETMELSTPTERLNAFVSPDFLLEASEYYNQKKDQEKQNEINTLIAERLNSIKPEDINPSNAYAYLLLAEQIKEAGFSSVYQDIRHEIATALYQYDQKYFPKQENSQDPTQSSENKSPKEIAADFEANYSSALYYYEDKLKKEEDEALSLMDGYSFEPPSWKDNYKNSWASLLKQQNKPKKDFYNLAAQLAALELAKTKNPSQEEMDEVFKEQLEQLLQPTSETQHFSSTEIAAKLAVGVNRVEEIKTRSEQKFGLGTKLAATIKRKLEPLDEKLSSRYGKKYQTAKKYALLCAKVGIGVAKSTAMFTVAGMIPPPGIGTATLIAYNTAKQWKNMKQQLSDPSISKNKKTALLLGAGVTTALGALSLGTGVNSAVQALGLDSPAALQSVNNTASSLGIFGRVSIGAVFNTVPNWVEAYTLKRQEKQLAQALINETDPQKRQEIINKQKALQNRKTKNKEEGISKALGAFLGSVLAIGVKVGISHASSSAPHDTGQANINATPNDVQDHIKTETPVQNTPEPVKTDTIAQNTAEVADTTRTETPVQTQYTAEVADTTRTETPVEAQNAAAVADTTRTETPVEAKYAAASVETPTQENTDTTSHTKAAPNVVRGYAAAAENTATAEQNEAKPTTQSAEQTKATQNLEAAKAENSGHINRSAHTSATADLESNQTKVSFTNEQIHTTAENMSKIYGANAYMATHAALAEPHAVAAAMGIDNIHTSAELLEYMQTHDCSNNEGLKTYMAEHFDEQQRFHYTETHHTATHTTTHTTVHHEPKAAEPATPAPEQTEQNTGSGLGFKLEPVDHFPGTEPQTAPHQTTTHTPQHHTHEPASDHHHPAEQVAVDLVVGSPEWARANGWVYDPVLSDGLNRLGASDGSHKGYQGAYCKASDPDQVMFLPNDPRDGVQYGDYKNSMAAREAGHNQYNHYNHDKHGYGCPDEKHNHIPRSYGIAHRVLYGTGVIHPNSGVDKVVAAVDKGALTAHQVLDVIHHTKHIFR